MVAVITLLSFWFICNQKFFSLIKLNRQDHAQEAIQNLATFCRLSLSGGNERITTRVDFEAYPWDQIEPLYFEQYGKMFQSLRKNMPAGMKAIGGVGNGVFECVQDLVGYMDLCYMTLEDPELCEDLFARIGEIIRRVRGE